MSSKDRPPRLGDYVSVSAVQNGQPGEVIVRCRIEGCRWSAQALHKRIAGELAYTHLWTQHGIRIERSPSPPPQRATVPRDPWSATKRRMGLA